MSKNLAPLQIEEIAAVVKWRAHPFRCDIAISSHGHECRFLIPEKRSEFLRANRKQIQAARIRAAKWRARYHEESHEESVDEI